MSNVKQQPIVKSESLISETLKNAYAKIQEKGIKEGGNRISFYNYPEFTDESKKIKFAGNKEVISGLIGKGWRANKRKQLDNFANRFVIYLMENKSDKLKELKISFDLFYKEYYRINDYSLNSVSDRTDAKNAIVKEMLQHFAKSK